MQDEIQFEELQLKMIFISKSGKFLHHLAKAKDAR